MRTARALQCNPRWATRRKQHEPVRIREPSTHELKRGKLKSGRSGKKVKSRKQAIAIGLSEARKKGAKVPPRKKRGK